MMVVQTTAKVLSVVKYCIEIVRPFKQSESLF